MSPSCGIHNYLKNDCEKRRKRAGGWTSLRLIFMCRIFWIFPGAWSFVTWQWGADYSFPHSLSHSLVMSRDISVTKVGGLQLVGYRFLGHKTTKVTKFTNWTFDARSFFDYRNISDAEFIILHFIVLKWLIFNTFSFEGTGIYFGLLRNFKNRFEVFFGFQQNIGYILFF